MKRLNIKLDPETHRKLKAHAAMTEQSIQAIVTQLIKHVVYQAENTK